MNESQVFIHALRRATAVERAAYLDQACAGDPALRTAVEALLRAHESDPGFLERPPGESDATRDFASSGDLPTTPISSARAVQAGTVLGGRYRLIEPIGEGGMGEVWSAQQTEPVQRMVAVKFIKPGMDSRIVLARFETERQALALMDHPGLAKVLDAGAAPDGRPFFVMELVEGMPITRFCDERRLPPRERLELFIQVCRAVQHAHQKGIIHRDIKPSNILVVLCDGRPLAKVIDFGVAKATGPQLTEQTLHTGLGTVVGTLEYMSPEQATFHAIDIDTRTDIYALGALLYELLTGSTPITRQTFRQAAFDEMLRLVREQQPQAPSSRLDTAIDAPSVAANRSTEPKLLGRFVRGEVDWIVMKALSKERDRRYESANGFARDIERFLAHEPVTAGPPTASYRLKKFVQRHRTPVIAALLILTALVAGIAGTIWGLIRAETAREQAVAEKAKAQQEELAALEDYRAATDDAIELLIRSKSEIGVSEQAFLEKLRRRWQAFAERRDNDERSLAIRAEGHWQIARLWEQLGRPAEALAEEDTSRDLLKKLTEQYPAVPKYQANLAGAHHYTGNLLNGLDRREAAQAEYETALALRIKLVADYPDDWVHRSDLAATHHNLANLLAGLGQLNAARVQYEKSQDLRERLYAERRFEPECRQGLVRVYIALASLLAEVGERGIARTKLEKARDLAQQLADNYRDMPLYRHDLAAAHQSLATVLVGLGDRTAARAECLEAIDLREKLVEEYHAVRTYRSQLGHSYCKMGGLVRADGKPADSLTWYEKAIATLTPLHRAEERNVVTKNALSESHAERAATLAALNRHEDAVKDWDRSLELCPPKEKPNHRAARATSLVHTNRIAEAVSEVRELTVSTDWTALQWYDFARVFAVAGRTAGDKKHEYAERAMEFLRRAAKAGYQDAAHMTGDADLDPLRNREDFRKLLADLAAAK